MGTTRNLTLFSITAIVIYSCAAFAGNERYTPPIRVQGLLPTPAKQASTQTDAKSTREAAAAGPASPSAGPSEVKDVSHDKIMENTVRTEVYRGSETGCNPTNEARAPISAISFVGFKYAGEAVCVNAFTDSQAGPKCRALSPTFTAVNPANPQYGTSISEQRDRNSYGFYWCVQTEPTLQDFARVNNTTEQALITAGIRPEWLNDKAKLCESVAPLLSNWGSMVGAPLEYDFSTAGNSDGDCRCRVPNGDWQNCDKAPPPGSVTDRASTLASPSAVSVPPSVDPTVVTASLNRCIERYTAQSNSCKEEAERAVASCDSSNNNNTGNRDSAIGTTAGVTQIMGQVYNMQNQGSGMQAECFRAGATANTAATAIRGMQEQCSRESGRCQALCRGPEGKTKEEEFKEICARELGKTVPQLEREGSADSDAFNNAARTIRENTTEGLNLCNGEVKKKSDTLSNLLNGVGRALQSSVQCACQTASNSGDCQNIPSVRDCSAIPQPAGCGAYDAMATCSVGSPSYNAKTCGCMQNPSAPGCFGGSNAISSFAGPALAGNLARGAGGGASFSGGAGGGRGSNFSLGANGEIENSDLSFLAGGKNGSGAANNSVGGGGAAGVGGGSNGAATEDKGALPEDDDRGLGGIFSQARNFMSNALGLAKKPAGAVAGNGALGKPDMGKFKPNNIRGIAGGRSGMGSRNMDIWKMMNACTSGDTCKSNENNYLVAP